MPFKSTLNYSPNFNSKKRLKKQIRFIILHYTGMKSEIRAINRLTNIPIVYSFLGIAIKGLDLFK